MSHPIRSVAVFCGSRTGTDPVHAAAAQALGTALAAAGMTLVYGGGGVGLMEVVADAAIGRRRPGAWRDPGIPDPGRTPLPGGGTELEITGSMTARKTRMFELADAFIALSGGLGTIDETVEMHHLAAARPARQAGDRAGYRRLGAALRRPGGSADRRRLRRPRMPPALCGGDGCAGGAGLAAGHPDPRCGHPGHAALNNAPGTPGPLAQSGDGGYIAASRAPASAARGGDPTDGA